MPREAPVISAMRPARGWDMNYSDLIIPRRAEGANPESITTIRAGKKGRGLWILDSLALLGFRDDAFRSARLGEQRQLPRRVIARALVGQRGWIVAGEAMVGELRPLRIAPLIAHCAINA